MRQLEKLHVEFNQLSDHDKSFGGILQHADHLYLKELKLKYKGAGFARLAASSLAKLHVENLQIEGFTLHQSAKLATKKGRLVDCLLWLDWILFYEGAPKLQLDRCRLQQGLSWPYLGACMLLAEHKFKLLYPTTKTCLPDAHLVDPILFAFRPFRKDCSKGGQCQANAV